MLSTGSTKTSAEELRARAKDALLTLAIASEEEHWMRMSLQRICSTMDGMDKQLAYVLASVGH